MAIIKPVIVPGKALKGGAHKVRISVSHNSDFRYIVTDIILNSAKEFKNGQIVKRPDAALLNTKLRGILQKYQSAIDELDYIEGLSCSELVYQIKNSNKSKQWTLKSICDEYVQCLSLKPDSLRTYVTNTNAVLNFLGDNLIINNISHHTLLALEKHMREKKLSSSTMRMRFSIFAMVIKYAQRCGYVQYKIDPFMGFKLPPKEVRNAWLSVEEIRNIRDYKPTSRKQALAQDLFMLSYYLGGINITDLMDINFNENPGTIKYIRKKTDRLFKLNKYVEFKIPKEALDIISKRKGSDGRIELSASDRKTRCHYIFDTYLRNLGLAVNLPNLIYYSARKSFSQHAFQLGVREAVIDYILGHKVDKGSSSLFHYISVTPEIATESVKKVVENLNSSN